MGIYMRNVLFYNVSREDEIKVHEDIYIPIL